MPVKGGKIMPARTSKAQQELDQALEDIGRVKEILQEAYTPEASREAMASAVGNALETLADYEDDEEPGKHDDE